MGVADPTDVGGKADRVLWPAPVGAAERQPKRHGAVLLGVHPALALAVVPRQATKEADIVEDLLFEVRRQHVLNARSGGIAVLVGEAGGNQRVVTLRGGLLEPVKQPHGARPAADLEEAVDLEGELEVARRLSVELERIDPRGHHERPAARAPGAVNVFGDETVGQAARVGGKVEAGRGDQRPVEELGARIVGVFVVVEEIEQRELAGAERDALARQRLVEMQRVVGIARHGVLGKRKGLAQEQADEIDLRLVAGDFEGLAVGKGRGADALRQAEATEDLRIDDDLGTLPQLAAENEVGRKGLPRLVARSQARAALVGRGKSRRVLPHEGRLAVQQPALGFLLGLQAGGSGDQRLGWVGLLRGGGADAAGKERRQGRTQRRNHSLRSCMVCLTGA